MTARSNVLGVGISPLDLPKAVDHLLASATVPEFSGYVTVTGVHGVMESQRDPTLMRIHNQSLLSVPDGMPMVWVGRWNGFPEISRVYGPDLMLKVFANTANSHQKHYLFGGGNGVAEKLASNLTKRFAGTSIVGKNTPPFRQLTESEEDQLVIEIQSTQPHFFWVGLSTPKQERFMHHFLKKYPNLTQGWDHGLIMLGVGAAFDFHAGLVPQAPPWMQKSGLEWFYRLLKEPRRLWKRYFYNNPRFVCKILLQLMKPRKQVS